MNTFIRRACQPTKQVALAGALLSLYWIVLPVPLSQSPALPSTPECLTRADAAPAEGPGAGSVNALERCSALLPADVELMMDLGAAHEAAHRFERAEEAYRRALVVDPEYAEARRRLAALMLRRGAKEDARAQLESALRVQPNRKALLDLLQF